LWHALSFVSVRNCKACSEVILHPQRIFPQHLSVGQNWVL
jgi:hypothetical protein